MANILEISNVSAYYDDLQIVQDLSLDFDGGIISIVGRNGMGKTTLAKSIMGLVKTTGSIKFCGTEISKMQPYQRAQLGIGYVPQGRRIFPSLTTEEHLTFCQRKAPAGTAEKDIWTVERIYEVLPRLYERRHLPGTSMSGGEQQMLAIARALMTQPKLIIMDEPSEGLAPAILDVLVEFFHQLYTQSNTSILLIEQNLGFCQRITDRTNVMNTGSIAYSGSLKALRGDTELSRNLLGVG